MRQHFIAMAAIAGAVAATAPSMAGARAAQSGCDASRPATAFASGGRLLHPQPRNAPIPCGVTTGFGSAESHVVVTKSGSVIFTPAVIPSGTFGTGVLPIVVGQPSQNNANPAGLAITRDLGRTWSLLKPSGATWNPTDHGDYVDPDTGRFFFEDYGPIPLAPSLGPTQEGPAHINVSSDEGRTWRHTALPAVFLPENPRFTSARPVAGGAQPTGYSKVTYFCANTNVGFVSPAIAGRTCYRSLDGGTTWTFTSVILSGTAAIHRECGSNGESYSAIDGYYPQPAPDGSLYLMVFCGGTTYLARSTDEAGSFPVLYRDQTNPITLPLPTGAVPELRIDSDGVMYLMWSRPSSGSGGVTPGGATNKLEMRVSRNLGRTWGRTLDLTPPGVQAMQHVSWELHGQGQVAAGVLGQRTGHTGYDGFIVETRDARVANPVFFSGMLNNPRRPLLFSADVTGSGYILLPGAPPVTYPPPFGFNFAGNDFIGTTFAPDGTPWASFTQDCGPAPSAAQCVKQQDQTRGFAGRLLWR